MSLQVNTRPSTTIGGETSRWNAVGNPIVYTMTRRDYLFNQSNNAGGFQQLQFTGVDISSSFSIGDDLYVSTSGFATVTASAFSGGNTLVTLNVAFGTSSSGFANNLTTRAGYRLEVELYNELDLQIGSVAISYSPNQFGQLTITVSEQLRAYLSAEIEADLTSSTEIFTDTNYTEFYIKYTEVWSGSAESQTDDTANRFYAVLGARQIPATYGGNLAEYVTFADGDPLASLLNRFTRPKMWRGFPLLVSVIVGDNVGEEVEVQITYQDNDGNTIVSNTSTAAVHEGELILANVIEIEAIPDDATVALIRLRSVDSALVTALTDFLTFDIVDPCDNPVYLIGRNSLGGAMQWMFDRSQEYTFDYGNGRKAKRLVLTARNITIDQWEKLHDFITLDDVYKQNITILSSSINKTSIRIGQQVYQVDEDGNKTGVIVIPTKNKTFTHRIKHEFEIEIEYPEIFEP